MQEPKESKSSHPLKFSDMSFKQDILRKYQKENEQVDSPENMEGSPFSVERICAEAQRPYCRDYLYQKCARKECFFRHWLFEDDIIDSLICRDFQNNPIFKDGEATLQDGKTEVKRLCMNKKKVIRPNCKLLHKEWREMNNLVIPSKDELIGHIKDERFSHIPIVYKNLLNGCVKKESSSPQKNSEQVAMKNPALPPSVPFQPPLPTEELPRAPLPPPASMQPPPPPPEEMAPPAPRPPPNVEPEQLMHLYSDYNNPPPVPSPVGLPPVPPPMMHPPRNDKPTFSFSRESYMLAHSMMPVVTAQSSMPAEVVMKSHREKHSMSLHQSPLPPTPPLTPMNPAQPKEPMNQMQPMDPQMGPLQKELYPTDTSKPPPPYLTQNTMHSTSRYPTMPEMSDRSMQSLSPTMTSMHQVPVMPNGVMRNGMKRTFSGHPEEQPQPYCPTPAPEPKKSRFSDSEIIRGEAINNYSECKNCKLKEDRRSAAEVHLRTVQVECDNLKIELSDMKKQIEYYKDMLIFHNISF